MRRIPSIAGCALGFVCLLSAAAPSHASRFGNPSMFVLTAKIAAPYSPAFNLNTGVSSWPPLLDAVTLTEQQRDPDGLIELEYLPDAFDTLVNVCGAAALSSGIYGTQAKMEDILISGYAGLFSYAQIVQDFRKDSVGAYCRFHIGYSWLPDVYSRATFLDDVRSEFAMDITASTGTTPLSSFHQDAGLRAWAGPAGPTNHLTSVHGPMSYTDTHPAPFNFDELLVFNPYTGDVDLSSLAVGDTFTVVFKAMSQVEFVTGDGPRGYSATIDPSGDGGVGIEVAGVTALDGARLPILSVGSPAAGHAALSPVSPNPAAGPVAFSLVVPREGPFVVDVFDLSGRRLAEVADRTFSAGTHALRWNATDDHGRGVPTGVYFVRASGPGFSQVRRLVRLAER